MSILRGRVNEQSHGFVIRQALKRAGISHGEVAYASILNVHVVEMPGDPKSAHVDFKNSEVVQISSKKRGDGERLPERVKIEGVCFRHKGVFDILNIKILPNGKLLLLRTGKTEIHASCFQALSHRGE
jgi:hypothetical protein